MASFSRLITKDSKRLFACALPLEQWAAGWHRNTLLVGVACRLQKPVTPVISFGFAGALHNGLSIGSKIDATKVVDANGTVLWEGIHLKVPGARPVTILAVERIINCKEERLDLCSDTGADAVDMESGIYARNNLFAGGIRVISDTPQHPLGSLPALWFGTAALYSLATVIL